jgi:hypothetical protein
LPHSCPQLRILGHRFAHVGMGERQEVLAAGRRIERGVEPHGQEVTLEGEKGQGSGVVEV